MCYLVQPRYQIFVKGYGFLSFAKSVGKNIGRTISENLVRKYSQKRPDHANLQQMHLKLLQKTTGDLIGNKIAKRITKISGSLPQNNSETITNEHD